MICRDHIAQVEAGCRLSVRVPHRISFAGGGTDLPCFYRRAPGIVVSTAINKYIHFRVHLRNDHQQLLHNHDRALTDRHQMTTFRKCLEEVSFTGGIEISFRSDIPPGSGLGGSSAFTTGVLAALKAAQNQRISRSELAELAFHIESVRCGSPVGKQDHYAAVFGGLRLFRFSADGSVSSRLLRCDSTVTADLNDRVRLYNTGIQRSASDLLQMQQTLLESDVESFRRLQAIGECASTAAAAIEDGDIDGLGTAVHKSWLLKRALLLQSSSYSIDDLYRKARKAGAIGGKLLGAGGGGHILFITKSDTNADLDAFLAPLQRISVRLEARGVVVTVQKSRARAATRM